MNTFWLWPSSAKFSAILLVALLASLPLESARAAGIANYEVFGFSRNGAYFAFEEYGVQDGSGFPYSNLFIVDTARDAWVRGTPVRAEIRREGVDIEQARRQMHRRGDPLLSRHRITTPGLMVTKDGATSADQAAKFVALSVPDDGARPGLGQVRIRLTEFPLPKADCNFVGEPTKGFTLTLEDQAGVPIRILEEDVDIPASRGCPLHYGISEVRVLQRRGKAPVIVVVLSIYAIGFEELDRRIMAVASDLAEAPAGPE